MFNLLLENKTDYLQHYEWLVSKSSESDQIILESRNNLRQNIYDLADADD